MNKKELINNCIDMSYNVSKEEMQKAIKEVSGKRYMETKMSTKIWNALFEKLEVITNGENGCKVLFYGSNAESYRQ